AAMTAVLRHAATQRLVTGRPLLRETRQALAHLGRIGVDGEPLPRLADRERPGEILPEMSLRLRRADRLRQLGQQLPAQIVDRGVQISTRHDPVDETPFEGPWRRDLAVEEEHL